MDIYATCLEENNDLDILKALFRIHPNVYVIYTATCNIGRSGEILNMFSNTNKSFVRTIWFGLYMCEHFHYI